MLVGTLLTLLNQRPCLSLQQKLTVAEAMRQAGYSTAMFGKWHFKEISKNLMAVIKSGQYLILDNMDLTNDGRLKDQLQLVRGCSPHAQCVLGHYTERPSCRNYHTNKTVDTIKSWNGPITGDDSHYIWYVAKDYITK